MNYIIQNITDHNYLGSVLGAFVVGLLANWIWRNS